MPYRPHILVQFGGNLPDNEIWSCGLRINVALDVLPDPELDQWAADNLADISTDVVNWVEREDSHLSAQTKLRFVKVNPIGADGRYLSEEITHATFYDGATPPHGVGVARMPNQVAVVATLHTDVMRGRASRGRIFTPALAVALSDGAGKIPGGVCVGLATSAAQLVTDLNDQPGVDDASQVGVFSGLGAGLWHPVTRVSVGDRMDIQRRRANSQTEVRQSVNV